MANKSLPFFPFYPKDWRSDEKVAYLTYEEKGVYVELLTFLWESSDATLPDNDKFLARILKITSGKWKELRETLIDGEFAVLQTDGARISQERLLSEWRKANDIKARRSDAGSKGGRPPKANALDLLKQNESKSKANAKQTPKQTESKPKAYNIDIKDKDIKDLKDLKDPGPGAFKSHNPEDDQVVHSPAPAQEPDAPQDASAQVLPDLTAPEDLSSSNGIKSQNREPTPNNETHSLAHWPDIWPVLTQAWFQHMGGLPPSATAEALKDYVAQGLTVPVIVDAMAQCERQSRRRDWGYLRGILENRRIRGHTTLDDVTTYERQRTGIRTRDAPNGKAYPDDIITWEVDP